MNGERNLREIFGILWSGRWLIILVTFLCTGSIFLVSKFLIPPVYTANVSLFVNNTRDISAVYTDINDINASQKLVFTYMEMAKSESVLDLVEQSSRLGYTAGEISDMLTVSVVNDTEIFKISVKNENPQHAKDIANTFAKVAPAEIQDYVEASSVKVIYYASLPLKPTSPNVLLNTLFGFLLSFLLAAFYVIVKQIFSVRITSEDDITEEYNLSMLSIVPKTGKRKRAEDAILSEKSSFFTVEAYKSLRTNLKLSLENCSSTGKIVGVTSALASDGKSTICANLASVFAAAGLKVLVVDADMRRPQIHKLLKLEQSPGLSDFLAGEFPIEDITARTDLYGLDVVCSGTIPGNPSELLESDLLRAFFESIEGSYDYIFIDLPAVCPVTDPVILSKYVTGIVLVTRYNFTHKKALEETITKLEFANANLLGAVLNDVDISVHGPNYRYQYKYRYKYKYDSR